MNQITWGRVYWPLWLGVTLASFLAAEILGLVQGGQNTLSNFIWQYLKIAKNEAIWQWSALDFLIFGSWLVVVTWLTFHFFFRTFSLYNKHCDPHPRGKSQARSLHAPVPPRPPRLRRACPGQQPREV